MFRPFSPRCLDPIDFVACKTEFHKLDLLSFFADFPLKVRVQEVASVCVTSPHFASTCVFLIHRLNIFYVRGLSGIFYQRTTELRSNDIYGA